MNLYSMGAHSPRCALLTHERQRGLRIVSLDPSADTEEMASMCSPAHELQRGLRIVSLDPSADTEEMASMCSPALALVAAVVVVV